MPAPPDFTHDNLHPPARRVPVLASARKRAQLPPPRVTGQDSQPVSTVIWMDPADLHANDYNPNHVAPMELVLLAISILEDGWTQPIVARLDGEIVDGFHRWSVGQWPELLAMTGGKVPVVHLVAADAAHQRMSTIRHNRARGTHAVVPMADIVASLVELGVARETIATRLQMDDEEVDRLLDRGQMTKRGVRADGSFGNGWIPG